MAHVFLKIWMEIKYNSKISFEIYIYDYIQFYLN